MRVKLLTSRAGVDFSQSRGEIVEVSSDEGARLIAGGLAEPVRDAGRETAASKRRSREKAAG